MYQNDLENPSDLETLREENRELSNRLAETESELIQAHKEVDKIRQSCAPDSVSKDELVRSKTGLIAKIEQKLNARNVKLKKFDSKVKYLLEELTSKDKAVSKLKTQLMLEEEQSAQSEEKFQNLMEIHEAFRREADCGISEQDLDALKEEMRAREEKWNAERQDLIKQKEAVQQTLMETNSFLNEQAIQGQRITLQLSEMTKDIRDGMREREALNTEKQHLTRELAILTGQMARDREQLSKFKYDLRKSQDDVKEYHRFLKRSARELESAISDLKLLQSKTSECQIDVMAKNHFFLKLLKFLKSRAKRLANEGSGFGPRKRQYRKSSMGARSDHLPDVRISNRIIEGRETLSSISLVVKDDVQSQDFEDIGGSPLPPYTHSPRAGLSAIRSCPHGGGRSVSPLASRARSPSVHSNLSELSVTEMNYNLAEKRAITSSNINFPIPPSDMSSTNRYYEVLYDGLKLFAQSERDSEVLSFLRKRQYVFVVEETEDFYRISEPRNGWILKKQQMEQASVQDIYEEYRVSGDSQTLFSSIGGAEIRSMIPEMLVLTCERLGDWIRIFYPSRGWMKIVDNEGKPVLERKRFLSDNEVFHDYTHPGFKLVKFTHRSMLQYGMILKPRVENSESVVIVSETITPFLRKEVPIGSVLQAVGHTSVLNMRYLECMKTIETCSLPVILVLKIPEISPPQILLSPMFVPEPFLAGRRLSTQSLPSWKTPKSPNSYSTYSRLGGRMTPKSVSAMSEVNAFPPIPMPRKVSSAPAATKPLNFNFQRNEISVFLMNYADLM